MVSGGGMIFSFVIASERAAITKKNDDLGPGDITHKNFIFAGPEQAPG